MNEQDLAAENRTLKARVVELEEKNAALIRRLMDIDPDFIRALLPHGDSF